MMSEENKGLQLGIEALLENFLVQRKDNPEVFREILSSEKMIRKYMVTNFGYQLKLDSETAKLEKIPFFSRDWMGIQSFKNELDYVFLMALFSILETKSFEDGFLLSSIIEDVKIFLLGKDEENLIYEVDWKVKHQRESFSRALLRAQETGLIKLLDGELSSFEKSEEGEVLYQSTSLIRYQFRNFSKKIDSFETTEEMLLDGLDKENVRHSLFRKLYFESVLFFDELSEEEMQYLNDKYNYEDVKQQIELYTFFRLERMYNCICLVQDVRRLNLQQHPSRKHESYIVSQIAYRIVGLLREEKPFGLLVLENSRFEDLLKDVIQHFSLGWSSSMRDKTPFSKFKQIILDYMTSWKLASYDDATMKITIYPSMIRTVGEYDADLRDYIDTENIRGK